MSRARKKHHLRRHPGAAPSRRVGPPSRSPRALLAKAREHWARDDEVILGRAVAVGGIAVLVAVLGIIGGIALGLVASPLVRDAVFREAGPSVEVQAQVGETVEGRALLAFTTDYGHRVETVAGGAYNPIEDTRTVTVRYLPDAPHEVQLRPSGPSSWLLVPVLLLVCAVAWCADTWYRGGLPGRERRRLVRKPARLPVARWALPAVLCLGAAAALYARPFLGTAPADLLRLDPGGTWFAAATTALLTAVVLARTALARYAARTRPRRTYPEPSTRAVVVGLVLVCLPVFVVPASAAAAYFLEEREIAEGSTVQATVHEVTKESGGGCWYSARLSYEAAGMPHERSVSVHCSDAGSFRAGAVVPLGISDVDPTRVRPAG
ncbi:hypothetical protein [Nocardiopsis ganjiahuensis]|uniref:hypothetical protein n=1 Tax=Nocardiopsis ganjiahuensis TaxID=239984 RepID=UPI00034C472F|nr:hypothetical protein [Nocardiopsis ganjiahuensis]